MIEFNIITVSSLFAQHRRRESDFNPDTVVIIQEQLSVETTHGSQIKIIATIRLQLLSMTVVAKMTINNVTHFVDGNRLLFCRDFQDRQSARDN